MGTVHFMLEDCRGHLLLLHCFFPPECSYSSKTNALHSVDLMRDEERGDSEDRWDYRKHGDNV